jgi:FtsZ-binding cell division protein ZapB
MEENSADVLMQTITELEEKTTQMQQRIQVLENERGEFYDQNQLLKRDHDELRERVVGLIAKIEELEDRQASSRLF